MFGNGLNGTISCVPRREAFHFYCFDAVNICPTAIWPPLPFLLAVWSSAIHYDYIDNAINIYQLFELAVCSPLPRFPKLKHFKCSILHQFEYEFTNAIKNYKKKTTIYGIQWPTMWFLIGRCGRWPMKFQNVLKTVCRWLWRFVGIECVYWLGQSHKRWAWTGARW